MRACLVACSKMRSNFQCGTWVRNDTVFCVWSAYICVWLVHKACAKGL